MKDKNPLEGWLRFGVGSYVAYNHDGLDSVGLVKDIRVTMDPAVAVGQTIVILTILGLDAITEDVIPWYAVTRVIEE